MRLGIALALLLLSGTLAGQEEAKKPEAPKPAPKEEMKQPEPLPTLISIEKSSKPDPCIIKPVMTDKELRDCGARIPR